MTSATVRPFTTADFQARMSRAAIAAKQVGLAGLLIPPGPDLAYFCGYRPPATERLTALVLSMDRPATMVVPRLERPDAYEAASDAVELVDWLDGSDAYALLAALLPASGRYGIGDSAWAIHLLGLQAARPGLQFVAASVGLPMLRAVKDADELQRLAAAGAAADAAYRDILGVQFAGRREMDIAGDLADLLRRHGHSQVDFTVVGSGPNGANPHHQAGQRIVTAGDVVVLDFGGLKDGYGSDTTRTVYVGAAPPAEVCQVHDLVREAQQAGFDAVRPGATCQDIDRAARQVIVDGGYGAYFIHRTGHGIGLTTHEPPYLVEGETQPLVPGMCFSIEPGIYLPGQFGVRVEDIVTVTADGGRRLNTTPHELAIVA